MPLRLADVDAQFVDDRVDVGAERHPDRRLRLFVPTDGADEVAHLLVRAEFEGERCFAEHVQYVTAPPSSLPIAGASVSM